MKPSLVERLRRRFAVLVPSGGLAERTVTSGIWTTLINVSDRALQIVMLVVLARLLDPAEFGLLGIALLSVAVMRQFTKLGLDTALIQDEAEDVDAYLNTVWVIKVSRGLLIVAAMYVAAPFVAGFFGEPRATGVLRVIALSPLFKDLRNPYMVYFRKDLEFHKQFVYQVTGTVVQVAVAIALALLWGNVWALVAGTLGGHLVRTVVSYGLLENVPRPAFDADRARELVNYGKWMTGLSVFGFLFSQGDDAFVGWLLGATALGFYQMAYRLSRAPTTEVTHVISMTMLSTYSKLQHDHDALRDTYFTVLKLVVTVTAPMSLGIVVVAPEFVRAFLGAQWLETVVLMQVLAVWGYLLSIGATSGPLLKAIGRPDYLTKASAAKTLALALLIYPAGEAYGVFGVSVAVVASAALTSEPYITYSVLSEVDAKLSRFLWTVGVPTAASLLMGLAVAGVPYTVPFESSVAVFSLQVVTGAVVYTAVMLVLDSLVDFGIRDLVVSIARSGGTSPLA